MNPLIEKTNEVVRMISLAVILKKSFFAGEFI